MNIKKLCIFSSLVFLSFLFVLVVFSCDLKEKDQNDNKDFQKSEEVISLFDSIGVGDVPNYPGSIYDNELNDQLGEFRNQLIIPENYLNVLFSVRISQDHPSKIIDYYNSKLQELNWRKDIDLTSGSGGFMRWLKSSNYEKDVSFMVSAGKINYGGREETVVLTGFIIPKRDDENEIITENTKEGSEIGPGNIFFENQMPPEGEGLLSLNSITSGMEDWQKWLQGGSKVKGNNEVSLIDDKDFTKAVRFYRDSEPYDGGAAGIYQNLDLDLDKYSKVSIWLVGKVLKEKGGNIANVNHPAFPEGAVQVRIKYITEDNSEKEWFHSFFYSNIIYYDKTNCSLVLKDRWFWYESPNLLGLKQKPSVIKEIRVYGFGWEFEGHVSEINIIASK